MSPTTHPGQVRSVGAATVATVVGILPVTLLGALAVFIRSDLAFTEARLGLVVAIHFTTSAVLSVPLGHLVERVGARRSIFLGAAASGGAMLGVAALAGTWGQLVVWMVLAGVGNAITQVAGNRLLARAVRPQRHSFAFGVKQASIPISTLLAGVAIPLLALTVGWRWAFVAALGLIALVVTLTPETADERQVLPGGPRRLLGGGAPLVILAVATTFGSASANSLGAFFVESSVSGGVPVALAGVGLTVGSIAAITARVTVGWLGDRWAHGQLLAAAFMLVVGAAGYTLLVVGGSAPFMFAGAILAFGAGWGWTGLVLSAVVRVYSDAPAVATGVTQAGTYVGGVVGPLAFGTAVQHLSYAVAWRGAAAAALLAAGFAVLADRLARHSDPARAATGRAVGVLTREEADDGDCLEPTD